MAVKRSKRTGRFVSTKRKTTARKTTRRAPVKRKTTRRKRNPTALIANPSQPIFYIAGPARKRATTKKSNPKKRKSMPKRRRKTTRRRTTSRRRAPARRRVTRRRRNPTVYMVAPRRRRRSRRSVSRRRTYRRRRNPSGNISAVNAVKKAVSPYLAGMATAAASAAIDKQLAGKPYIREFSKIAGVLVIAATAGRKAKWRDAASGAIGALGGTQGYRVMQRFTGGIMASSVEEAMEQAQLPGNQKNGMGVLLNGGMGVLLNGMGVPNIENYAENYEQAIENSASYGGDDEDEMEGEVY